MCQQTFDSEFSLGSVASVVWSLTQSTPYYIFNIEYEHGNKIRKGIENMEIRDTKHRE